MRQAICGAMTALITPFRKGELDEAAYASLIERQIENGIDAVVPVGTTGESATLSHDEHKRCIEIAVEVCKGTDTGVLAGAGSNATHEAIDIAVHAQQCGADALLSVTPYYNKPSQEGLYRHYRAIAEAVDIPVMLYNVPGRTSVDLKPETVFRLFDDVRNIYAIKEATGSMERAVNLLAERPSLCLVSGDDAIDYPLLAEGASGVISVTANLLPDMKSEMVHSALSGDFKRAKEINDSLYPVNKVLFVESNPIPIKAAMYIAGLLDTLEYRLPLTEPSAENMKRIEETIRELKIVEVKR
jgi:4-hydroxy-tetrahydrodipicolinate synthase